MIWLSAVEYDRRHAFGWRGSLTARMDEQRRVEATADTRVWAVAGEINRPNGWAMVGGNHRRHTRLGSRGGIQLPKWMSDGGWKSPQTGVWAAAVRFYCRLPHGDSAAKCNCQREFEQWRLDSTARQPLSRAVGCYCACNVHAMTAAGKNRHAARCTLMVGALDQIWVQGRVFNLNRFNGAVRASRPFNPRFKHCLNGSKRNFAPGFELVPRAPAYISRTTEQQVSNWANWE
ncbi:hypothetical protein C8J57DRAFT_1235137 [Mycena rebaudengoi]|nr:hypothetical protein C8J57DRAFT_1235137 [Mycena rebaudengoi]